MERHSLFSCPGSGTSRPIIGSLIGSQGATGMPRIDEEEEEEEEPAAGGSSMKIFSPAVYKRHRNFRSGPAACVHALRGTRSDREREKGRMHALHLLTRKCVRGNGFRIIENGDDSVGGRQKVGVRVRLFARFVARRMRWRHAPTYEERFEIVFFYELFLVCKRIRNEEIPNSGNIFGSITFIPLRSREARANRFTFRRDPECMRMYV